MSILRIINFALAVLLKVFDWLDTRRARKSAEAEVVSEMAKEKDATNLKVRGILDKLNSDPAYREEMIRKIRERANKAQ